MEEILTSVYSLQLPVIEMSGSLNHVLAQFLLCFFLFKRPLNLLQMQLCICIFKDHYFNFRTLAANLILSNHSILAIMCFILASALILFHWCMICIEKKLDAFQCIIKCLFLFIQDIYYRDFQLHISCQKITLKTWNALKLHLLM